MIQFIVCILLSAYVWTKIVRMFIPPEKNYIMTAAGICVGIMIMLLASFISIGICGIAFETSTHEIAEREKSRLQLVALGNSSEIKGSFFLACGSVGSEQVYRFYYQTSDGGKKFDQVSVADATIYEEDRQDAYLSKISKTKEYSATDHLWLIPSFMERAIKKEQISYAIHVPKGTVKQEYKLDLK